MKPKEFDMPIGIAKKDFKKGEIVFISMIKQNDMFAIEVKEEELEGGKDERYKR